MDGYTCVMPTDPENRVRFDSLGRALIAIMLVPSVTDQDVAVVQQAVLDEARAKGERVCVVALDISAMDTVNSVLLGMLVNLMTKLRLRDVGFCLVGVDPAIREMLTVTRLDRVFNVADTRADVEAFCE